MNITWKHFAPIVVGIVIALIPAPTGLPQHAWYYFAIFAAVIVGLMLEPLPGGAIGLIGVTLVARLSEYVFYSPEQLAKPGFNPDSASLSWALSGFSNATVWLIFGAFMFALGYEKTGLGRRIALMLVKSMGRKTLTLGYAVAIADTILAPFTPSSTARSGGTIYPVIKNLPLLYDSKPDDPSMRRIGSYLMWVAIAPICVTSTIFLTASCSQPSGCGAGQENGKDRTRMVRLVYGCARRRASCCSVFVLCLPIGSIRPKSRKVRRSRRWAGKELVKMGGITGKEIILGVLVVLALVMWIFRGDEVNATTAALIIICLMLVTNIVTWDDITKNFAAWNTLAWFATLVALADGLARVGFVKWFADDCGDPHERLYAAEGNPGTALINFFCSLPVRQRYRACYGA